MSMPVSILAQYRQKSILSAIWRPLGRISISDTASSISAVPGRFLPIFANRIPDLGVILVCDRQKQAVFALGFGAPDVE